MDFDWSLFNSTEITQNEVCESFEDPVGFPDRIFEQIAPSGGKKAFTFSVRFCHENVDMALDDSHT